MMTIRLPSGKVHGRRFTPHFSDLTRGRRAIGFVNSIEAEGCVGFDAREQRYFCISFRQADISGVAPTGNVSLRLRL